MFKCDNCKQVFEEPDYFNTSYEEEYGVSHLFPFKTPVTLCVCPYCGWDDFEEIEEEDEE